MIDRLLHEHLLTSGQCFLSSTCGCRRRIHEVTHELDIKRDATYLVNIAVTTWFRQRDDLLLSLCEPASEASPTEISSSVEKSKTKVVSNKEDDTR